MSCPCDLILDAADARFADYGYSKTTMAEIAGDCDMSVGNLYRHFKNKEAIAVASMHRILQGKLDVGIKAAAEQSDARQALAAFLQARLKLGHAHYGNTRHLFDMMALIGDKHQHILQEFENRVIDAMAEIIGRGIEQQVFHACDAHQLAYDIHQATLRYNNPIHLKRNPLKVLEADLQRLLELLYRGIAC